MQADLFLARPEDLNLLPSDGVVNDFGIVLSMIEADVIFSRLISEIAWLADTALINGNVIETRRQVAWYADTPSRYIHSGVLRQSLPWDVEILNSLRAQVERLTATTFNSCLLNRYEDGTQGMGWHSDSEATGEHAVIASLSLGGTRKFAFKHKSSGERREMALHHGQLIVMRGDISKQRWLVERLGWRNFMLGSISIYVLGAFVCGVSSDLTTFTAGRVVMALGGASFMTSARLMVNLLPPGSGRFVGVKVFATGLAIGTAAAPFLSSLVVVEDTWHAIFWLLIVGASVAAVLCTRFLPNIPIHEDDRTPSSPANVLLLSVSTFFLLYVLQRSYYDFYNEMFILLTFALLAALGVYIFFHAEHGKEAPFLKVKDLMQSRYILGVALFCFTYIVLGSNNYILPYFLQTALGYSWDTIGTFQAFGLAGALLTWIVMAIVIPKYPAPKKFFVAGFSALICFGVLLSSLTPDANMWSNILPALVLNGCFVMLVLATAAMQTFRDVTHHDTLFAHAYQIKSMLAQIAMALGTTVATLFLQWRTTLQYNNLNGHFSSGDPLYLEQTQLLAQALTPAVGAGPASQISVSTLAQSLHQQSTLVASMEYFWAVIIVASIALVVSMMQKTFK